MLFGKKKSKCKNCNSKVENKFSFCPYCGYSITKNKNNTKEFGLLGKNDEIDEGEIEENLAPSMGFSDKIFESLINSAMRSMEKQMKNMNQITPEDMANLENTSIEQLPNGIKIRIGTIPIQKQSKPNNRPKVQKTKEITQEQLERMSKLPRTEAKTKITRLNDRIVYELNAQGINSPDDVLISKLESGYEIKALGKSKIYVNSLPVSLPIKGFSFDDKKLLIEFKTDK